MCNYYVYRFVDVTNTIVYVGRTTDLTKGFLNHKYLEDDIKKVEYIKCQTKADMMWKEIYYINLFRNSKYKNVKGLYPGGVTDLYLPDIWKLYAKAENCNKYHINQELLEENYSLINNKELISKIHLIHICEYDKLNDCGRKNYSLTKSWDYSLTKNWFYDNENAKILSRNVTNYFRHICKAKTHQCLWTTFDEIKPLITGKGFRKGYVSLCKKSAYDASRIYLAYLCNNFYPPSFKPNVKITEDEYALSEILQFIWRSAIRDGKDIWVYIPSIRMRTLFKKWIDENSISDSE